MKQNSNVVPSPIVEGANVENLAAPEIQDATQTKGKVTGSFDMAKETENVETLKKNQVFLAVKNFFFPIDEEAIRKGMKTLVDMGLLDEEAIDATVAKQKKIATEKAENKTFAKFVEELKENDSLYQKVLQVCNISSIDESNYIQGEKVCIYRPNQFNGSDKEKYCDVSLSETYNNVKFTQNLFVERREKTTSNYIEAIKLYSSLNDAKGKLLRQIAEYKTILSNVYASAKKAKDNNFTKEQILAEIEKVFSA